jgi:predicted permease
MMRGVRRAWSRLVGSLRPTQAADRDLADEIDAHIRLMADEHVRNGMSPDEAYRQARLRFGAVEEVKERYRDARGVPLFDIARQDFRYALRGLHRNRGFAAVAILSLGIGIGANAAIFCIVDTVLLRPLAYADPGRVYAAREITSFGSTPVNPVHARTWGEACPSIESVALMRSARVRLFAGGEPVALSGAFVSASLFPLLGVEPIAGRAFHTDEDREGHDGVAVISEGLWRSRFDADQSVIGRSVLVDEQPRLIVGVMPASFRLPYIEGADVRFDVLLPLVLGTAELARVNGNHNYAAVLRVKPGVSSMRALAEVDSVQTRFRQSSGSSVGLRGRLIPAHEFMTHQSRLGLLMLSGAVGTVLLIVCVNLANLAIARTVSRRRESAIRTALGASRLRQFSQVLVESLVLSTCGGLLALAIAAAGLQLLVGATSLDIPRIHEVRLDRIVLLVSLGLTLVSGLLFGVLPA